MFRLIPAPFAAPNWLRDGALVLKKAGGAALDLIYPPTCLACRRAVSEHGGLCARCWRAMRFIERPYCERLGAPFETDPAAEPGGRTISSAALADPPVFARARAVARFEDGPARRLVHRLKYSDRDELAGPMGLWMARAGSELLSDADVLVPIPLHWTRLARRRFNQAAALARGIEKVSAVPVDTGLLLRVKPTPPQVGLTRRLRAQNIQGAFAVPEARKIDAEGRRIVLVDDVMTSGATLNAAARVLLRAGAERVDALVFARVVNR